MNNKNRIDEISELLAENILSENFLTKENIKVKCKVFLIAWQRINTMPKKDELTQQIIYNSNAYQLLKRYIKDEFSRYIDKNTIDELLQKFYKIEELMRLKKPGK